MGQAAFTAGGRGQWQNPIRNVTNRTLIKIYASFIKCLRGMKINSVSCNAKSENPPLRHISRLPSVK